MRRCPIESPFDQAWRCGLTLIRSYAVSVAVVAPPLTIPLFVYDMRFPPSPTFIVILISLLSLLFTLAFELELDQDDRSGQVDFQVLCILSAVLGVYLALPVWLAGSSLLALVLAFFLGVALHASETRLAHSLDGELHLAIAEATLASPNPKRIKDHIARIRSAIDDRNLRYAFVTRHTDYQSEQTWINTFYESLEQVYLQLDRHIIYFEPLDIVSLRQTLRELSQFGNSDPHNGRPVELGVQIHVTRWRNAILLNYCLVRYMFVGLLAAPFAYLTC